MHTVQIYTKEIYRFKRTHWRGHAIKHYGAIKMFSLINVTEFKCNHSDESFTLMSSMAFNCFHRLNFIIDSGLAAEIKLSYICNEYSRNIENLT